MNGDSSLDLSGGFCISEDVHQSLRRSILEEGDVLLTIAGADIGKCGIVEERHLPVNTNQAVGIMRVDQRQVAPRFLYYWFKQPQTFRYIQRLNAQAAQSNINLSMLRNIEVAVPSMSERQQIVSILSVYDDLIENNRRRIQLLEQAARLLYKEWFVRLRFPGHEHTPIVNGVPEGWERKKIFEVCETIGGGTPSTKDSEYWDGDITWVVPSDITNNNSLVLLESERKITDKGLRESSAKIVSAETILMTSRASIGFFALMDHDVCTNQGFINIIPHNDHSRMYLMFNLLSRVNEIRNNAKGTTYPENSKGRFREMDIIIPNKTAMEQFGEIAYNVILQVRCLMRYNMNLAKARDLLLPKLMNGEVVV